MGKFAKTKTKQKQMGKKNNKLRSQINLQTAFYVFFLLLFVLCLFVISLVWFVCCRNDSNAS